MLVYKDIHVMKIASNSFNTTEQVLLGLNDRKYQIRLTFNHVASIISILDEQEFFKKHVTCTIEGE